MPEQAFIGIGSNLGDRRAYLEEGLADLTGLEGVRPMALSSLYETAPQGYLDQPLFLNAVLSVQTDLGPVELLQAMQQIEDGHLRRRTIHWGPRTLDLDLLLHGTRRVNSPDLVLPHPRITTRSFVLVPLCEIAPDLRHPCTGKSFRSYRDELGPAQEIRKVGALHTAPAGLSGGS